MAFSVLLLRNMVSPGEIDTELENEVAVECSQYGRVQQVLLHEYFDRQFARPEVNVFVVFPDAGLTAVQAAVSNLHGRYFAGRRISAQAYDPAAFFARQLEG
ncbi:unnamed protein product [Protopolystoma xenopodis]|uniref:RNA recognition motif domain-containing protein n=1 Tax=Protopolystoma xenopodis TaxID=117903 RepID=A0A3S5CJ10_9PLAT|nr:unnamed protein product [Protopolystoma xenopodis]